MTDLSNIPTDELRRELREREERQRNAEWEIIRRAYPCPDCGADPREVNEVAVEEFRFAPRDDEGFPVLFAPLEMGTTNGMRYRTTVTCENGHQTYKDEIRWFDGPITGPPLLRTPA